MRRNVAGAAGRLWTEPESDLPKLRGFLDRLTTTLALATDSGSVEFVLSSTGSVAASVYLGQRLTTSQADAVLSAVPLPAGTREVFWSLLSHIPTECHMVRLAESDRFGIAFKTDVSARLLTPLLDSLGLTTAGGPIVDYFSSRDRPACGVSFEVRPDGAWRVRLYDMARDAAEIADALERLGNPALDPNRRREVGALASHLLKPKLHAVVNLAASAEAGFSVKVEIPGVDFDRLPPAISMMENEWETYRRARALGRRLGEKAFTYIGWRVDPRDRRELTFYLDARRARFSAPL